MFRRSLSVFNSSQTVGMCSKTIWLSLLCILLMGTVVLFALGTLLWSIGLCKLNEKILDEMQLGLNDHGNYTETTLTWMDPKYEMFFQVFTFSVYNHLDFLKQPNSTPEVLEKGPYVFCEYQQKEVIEIRPDRTRIFYRNFKYYYFDQSRSCQDCFLNDVVTVPNFILQEIWNQTKDQPFAQIVIEGLIGSTNTSAFLTMTVAQLLFDGYEDKLLVALSEQFPEQFKNQSTTVGLFYEQNGKDDGVYEVGTGVNRSDNLGWVYSWNGQTAVNAWYKAEARQVHGYDGQIFRSYFFKDMLGKPDIIKTLFNWPPTLSRSAPPLDIFVGRMCRTVRMEQKRLMTIDNVVSFEYSPSPEMNDIAIQSALGFCNPNATQFFDDPSVQEWGCAPHGLMDMSSCIPGAQFYISQPHFLDSPKQLRRSIYGVRKGSRKEATKLYVDLLTGTPIRAQQTYQLSVGVVNGSLTPLIGLKKLIIPVIWINESANYDQNTRDQVLRSQTALRTIIFGALGLYIGALVLFILFVFLLIKFICALHVVRVGVVNDPLYVKDVSESQ
ncbi:CD36 family protein [Aphelenchoides besseyi]|nr:CD36 family protein [Aphelenchoides besseyi]KAI6209817.1 CD36 family protein [Aphelenchoides besseyi]